MLQQYFENLKSGPGVWKWVHYLALYEEHFSRFVGSDAVVAEVGIYSGGSLRMWREYFGDNINLYGIDISPNVTIYDGNPLYGSPTIFVGSQSDSSFWNEFTSRVPSIDVFIDDGSHRTKDQMNTFECIWPHIAADGLYWIEDVAPINKINTLTTTRFSRLFHNATFMRNVHSMTFHNGVIVVRKRHSPLSERPSVQRKGTIWQPNAFWKSGGKEQTAG